MAQHARRGQGHRNSPSHASSSHTPSPKAEPPIEASGTAQQRGSNYPHQGRRRGTHAALLNGNGRHLLRPNPSGMTHFWRGQRGQMRKKHLTHCHHSKKLSPATPGTNRFLPGTTGTNESIAVQQHPAIETKHNLTPLGRVTQQSGNAARITRTGGRRGGPKTGGHVSTVHRPPFSKPTHCRTHGARITLTRGRSGGPEQSR